MARMSAKNFLTLVVALLASLLPSASAWYSYCTPKGCFCMKNEMCCSGSCDMRWGSWGLCARAPAACIERGETCAGGGDCCTGSICRNGKCRRALKGLGERCRRDRICESGFCDFDEVPNREDVGKCAKPCKEDGKKCRKNKRCCSGSCDMSEPDHKGRGTCVDACSGESCMTENLGNPCQIFSECRSGECVFNSYCDGCRVGTNKHGDPVPRCPGTCSGDDASTCEAPTPNQINKCKERVCKDDECKLRSKCGDHETCEDGICVGGACDPADCEVPDACTDGACDTATNACAVVESACQGSTPICGDDGNCVAACNPADCEGPDACTAGACDPATGDCATDVPSVCQGTDFCGSGGTCVPCSLANNPCDLGNPQQACCVGQGTCEDLGLGGFCI